MSGEISVNIEMIKEGNVKEIFEKNISRININGNFAILQYSEETFNSRGDLEKEKCYYFVGLKVKAFFFQKEKHFSIAIFDLETNERIFSNLEHFMKEFSDLSKEQEG